MSTSRPNKSPKKFITPNLKINSNNNNNKRPNTVLVTRDIPKIPNFFSELNKLNEYESKNITSLSILETSSKLSTPRSIQKYIENFGNSSIYENSLLIIKKAIKKYLSKKKMRHFLDFLKKLRFRKLKYVLSLWRLTLIPPANIAINNYKEITDYLIFSGFLLPLSKDPWKIKHTNNEFVPFNIYIQTNFLFFNNKIDILKIIKLCKNFERPNLKKIFLSWFSISSERFILAKSIKKIKILSNFRNNFGSLFWTYHMWKRWTIYQKKKKIDVIESIQSQFYIPEWGFYKSKKLTHSRQRRESTLFYQKNLIHRVCTALHDKSVINNARENSFKEIIKFLNKNRMIKVYRSFITLVNLKKMEIYKNKRIIRSWYKVIDEIRIKRLNLELIKKRKIILILNNYFRNWRTNILEEGSSILLQQNKILSNQLNSLRIIFLLKNDQSHYLFITSFLEWKKLILKRKFTKKFINWSLNYSKNFTLIRSIFDFFKINAELPLNKLNYYSFKIDTEKIIINNNNNNIPNFRRGIQKRRLSKVIRGNKENNPLILIPTNSINDVLLAYKNINNFKEMKYNNIEKLPSIDIRNLFYQIILLKSNKPINNIKTKELYLEELKQFRIKNMLFNQLGIIEMKQKYEKLNNIRHNIMLKRLKRDNDMILSMTAHDAAISLSKVLNTFTINNSPRFLTENSIIYELKNDENIDEIIEIRKEKSKRHSIKPKNQLSTHPLLQPIDKLKEEVLQNVRKYRHKPEPIHFRTEKKQQRTARTTVENFGTGSKLAQQTSIYENFIPINPKNSITKINSIKEFKLSELNKIGISTIFESQEINNFKENIEKQILNPNLEI